MASRRRRNKNIGRVISNMDSRLRKSEKRLSPTRIKRNVITADKLVYRSVTTKTIATDAVQTQNIAADAVTPIEASFGVNIVSSTEPDPAYLKAGTQWTIPETGATQVYDTGTSSFVDVTATDAAAQAAAAAAQAGADAAAAAATAAASAATAAQTTANGKNKIIRSTSDASGTTGYTAGDIWWKMASTSANSDVLGQWTFDGTAWRVNNLTNAVIASLDAAKITTGYLAADRIQANSIDVNVLQAGTLKSSILYSGTINAQQINAGTLNGITINATNGGKIGAWQIGAASQTGSGTYQALTSTILSPGDDASKLEISYTIDTTDYSITGRNSYLLYLSNGYSSIKFATDSVTNSAVAGRILLEAGSAVLSMGFDGQGIGYVMDLSADIVQVSGTSYSVNGLKNISATTATGTPSGGSDGDIVLVYTA